MVLYCFKFKKISVLLFAKKRHSFEKLSKRYVNKKYIYYFKMKKNENSVFARSLFYFFVDIECALKKRAQDKKSHAYEIRNQSKHHDVNHV